MQTAKRTLKFLLAWLITAVALYYAFRTANWTELWHQFSNVGVGAIAVAVALTCLSYMLRARRWEYFFDQRSIKYVDALRVLVLGFFMNNVLPARAGELVRAHLGAKVTGRTRTLVLATIAAERLADGLMLSLMFVVFALGVGERQLSHEFLYVAYLFGAVAVGVAVTLAARRKIFSLLQSIMERFQYKAVGYTLSRVQIFVEGLMPMFMPRRLPLLVLWSAVIWTVELMVYISVAQAFNSPLPIDFCVLFMVAVNFSSLIPAAPGGLGVIEAVGSAVLVSVGVDRELALAMVITQHLTQYLVVGIPGALIMFTWRSEVRAAELSEAV